MAVIKTRAELEAVPVGSKLLDVDGYDLTKVADGEYLMRNPYGEDTTLDTDEVMGTYSDDGSHFLPALLLPETEA